MCMIVPNEFDYHDSRWQDLFLFLKGKAYDVYPPGEKLGDCTSEYLVVKYSGTAPLAIASSRRDLYDIMCYVPRGKYSKLEALVQRVRTDLKEIEPLFLPYDMEQDESVYDTSNDGHYVTITYCNYKKN